MFGGGVVLVVLGAVLLTSSAIALSQANSATAFPTWSSPPHQPARVRLLRAGGVGMTVYGSILLHDTLGYWSVGLVVVAFTGTLGVHMHHNRQVRTAGRTE